MNARGQAGDRIDPDDVRRVKERADIVALALQWVPGARKKGREVWAPCPVHSEKTPSFSVSPKGFFHCFGCRWHGDVFKLYGWHQGSQDFPAQVRGLADYLGVAIEGRTPAPVSRGARRAPPPPAPRPDAAREAERKAKRLAGLLEDWKQARPLLEEGQPPSEAARYLKGRGLDVALLAPWLGALRCHPALPYLHPDTGKLLTRAPAMMALIQAADRSVVGLHVTYLQAGPGGGVRKLALHDADGEVMPAKRMMGRAQGGAVRLWPEPPALPGAELLAGEGIESIASILQRLLERAETRERLERGAMGCLALLSLGNWAGREPEAKRRFRHPRAEELRARHRGRTVFLPATEPAADDPPAWIPALPGGPPAQVTWCADADNKDPESAECLLRRGARRVERQGIAVRIARPPAGSDFNQVLQRREGVAA